ncbi:hydrogenase maturation nickel metallochaperone HypA [Salinarchaeum sp. IM2453]|uniref:hydrogenase maturation nickel metallochaperone HypA/HybF n=1 Tax=Salinarchaeum sp. IM2453 TaxID=2862870 RepID=UPI001C837DD7|nr:hydrogenase maturation nickel metallochaperone HypA [Salinarchaeum sp. IM2453]QZA88543.1 hydrogenase maturation nickel metallochaperone HypA [Salinarchaeum sp. IM2453]
MHEMTIAQDLIDEVSSVVDESEYRRVQSVTISVGERTHINPTQLEFCIETIAVSTLLEDASIAVERIETLGKCSCGWSGTPPSIDDSVMTIPTDRCPECNSQITFTQGDGCYLSNIRLQETSSSTSKPT